MSLIYLHIPFCKTRCVYCDFYSTTCEEQKDRYIRSLCKELSDRKGYLKDEPVETVYFGGGTPSQLTAADLGVLLDTIAGIYNLDSCHEITLEANPDDLTPEYIAQLAALPVNRLSIGAQTFNDRLLALLNRRHTARQTIEAVRNCRRAGFDNISIDLMYGLPGESSEDWSRDLEQALELGVEHISAYHLIYEEGTRLWQMKQEHTISEVSEDDSLDYFKQMIDTLTHAGYLHYEISNFCLPGKHSRHNSSYWQNVPYLGCGASAHSFDGDSRQWNVSSLEQYMRGVESDSPCIEKEVLDLHTRYNDFVITSLRTMWGLSLDKLHCDFGPELVDYCLAGAKRYINNGRMERRDDTLYISKEGIFVSDAIMSDLLWVD